MSRFRKFGTLVGLEEDNVIPEAGDQNVDNVPEIVGLQAEKALNDVDETCQAGECLVTDVNTVNNVQNLIKEKAAEGEGIPQATAEVVDVVMESIYTRWGMGRRYSNLRRKYSLEDYVEEDEVKDDDNFFVKVWTHIKNFFIRLWNAFLHIIGAEDGPLSKQETIFKDTLLVKIRSAKGLETIKITEINANGKKSVEYGKYIEYIDKAGNIISESFEFSFKAIQEVFHIFEEEIFTKIEKYEAADAQACVVYLETIQRQYNIILTKIKEFSISYSKRTESFNTEYAVITDEELKVTGIDKGWYESLDVSLSKYETIFGEVKDDFASCNNTFVKVKKSLESLSTKKLNFFGAEVYKVESENKFEESIVGIKCGNITKGDISKGKAIKIETWFTNMVTVVTVLHKELKDACGNYSKLIGYFNDYGMKNWF